jgi:hypothetical protein
MLNLFQHLIKSIYYETLKRVQGDKKWITTQPHKEERILFLVAFPKLSVIAKKYDARFY